MSSTYFNIYHCLRYVTYYESYQSKNKHRNNYRQQNPRLTCELRITNLLSASKCWVTTRGGCGLPGKPHPMVLSPPGDGISSMAHAWPLSPVISWNHTSLHIHSQYMLGFSCIVSCSNNQIRATATLQAMTNSVKKS